MYRTMSDLIYSLSHQHSVIRKLQNIFIWNSLEMFRKRVMEMPLVCFNRIDTAFAPRGNTYLGLIRR